jgi:hypothetical protein
MKRIFISLGVIVLLSGCELAPGGGQTTAALNAAIDAAVAGRMQMNDKQTRITIKASCDVPLGSYYREATPTEQKGLRLLCSGKEDGEANTVP